MRLGRMGALLACAALAVGCTDAPEPVLQPEPTSQVVVSEYDASLQPSVAVLSLVPTAASAVVVTDFDQLRLLLGFGSLDGDSPQAERARFWRMVPRTAALTRGLLRPVDERLRQRFGFGQDDVAWEATYSGDAAGWVLALHDDVPMADVERAVRARIGPLRGAVVDADRRLVSSRQLPAADASWGAEPELVALAGTEAASTYLQRGCLEFDTVFGAGMEEQLAATPADALDALDPLEAFAVALGGELATVHLGPKRSDAFDRVRIAEVMPRTEPEFGTVLGRGVADPSTGRLGYVMTDPVAAARLTRDRQLPFAVCAG